MLWARLPKRCKRPDYATAFLLPVRCCVTLGYFSWAFGQAARDPFYIMVVIYIFFPYFSGVVVGDPVKGQSIIGYINASVGFVLAATILFQGPLPTKLVGANHGSLRLMA